MSALSIFVLGYPCKKILLQTLLNAHVRAASIYKKTVLLPETDFPHWVKDTKRVEKDRYIEKEAKFDELYKWQLKNNKGQLFVLHDGPPYANGDVHIGHAVNKILKDITLRSKLINGSPVHFVPGWDCHGLPIELKVIKEARQVSSDADKIKLRKDAYNFAQKAKNEQLSEFRKWGLLADWNNIYYTCHPDYVINQLKLFYSLYEKKLIYQDYKPVYWSPWNRTSLAEAELEYNPEHKSLSAYIKFPVQKCPEAVKNKLGSSRLFLLIWTTTPWTIPANQAICFASEKRYSLIKLENGETFVVASEMLSAVKIALKTEFEILGEVEGSVLKDITYSHPLYKGKELPVLSAGHVTMSKGTGLVHMAPNHGFEDYIAAQEHKISLEPCLVGEDGTFLPEAGKKLSGKDVLSDGNEKVIEMLSDCVVCLEKYSHSYPYDWRSNKPVIIRSSHQWFVDIQSLKQQSKLCLDDVEIIPENLKKTFYNQLEKSPQWCISRQRSWGVPIPIFYEKDSKSPLTNEVIIEHLCQLIKEKGIHSWWELSEEVLLPKEIKQKCGIDDSKLYVKSPDILDIWFDSGVSWNHVLAAPHISDVCIEGVDQIRGWFHSSLVTSVASRGVSPYRKLFLHGFTTDMDGCKMSKSKGNVIAPADITDGVEKRKLPALGSDVLRWWVSYHACQHENIPVKRTILDECYHNILKLRNTFKFLLGNLYGFRLESDKVPVSEMRALDQYMLHLLKLFSNKIDKSYENMQYNNVAKEVLNFATNDISSYYCQLVKDRLYCEAKDSVARLSCQTVLSSILDVLVKVLAPIVPHLVEEVMLCHPNKEMVAKGAFRRNWESLFFLSEELSFPDSILWANQVRNTILKCERKMANLEAHIFGSKQVLHHLQALQTSSHSHDNLCELFQISKVHLVDSASKSWPENVIELQGTISSELAGDSSQSYTVVLMLSSMKTCPRCRFSTSETDETLCRRCQNVVTSNADTQRLMSL